MRRIKCEPKVVMPSSIVHIGPYTTWELTNPFGEPIGGWVVQDAYTGIYGGFFNREPLGWVENMKLVELWECEDAEDEEWRQIYDRFSTAKARLVPS
ncbi:MAG: hypothetical protein HC888_00005 [Candidatus Competibacteraceae bacterium]|nr:hypothetical protein [Candidatus Competibacteraceae bacterium]